MAFSSAAASMPALLLADTLASCELIAHRIHQALANSSGLIILHRSQWQCLARSYSQMLQALTHFFQPALGTHPTLPLHALQEAMLEGERCMCDCIANPSSLSNHSWLLDKALKLGSCTDVVDLHLQRFLCAFSSVLDAGLNITPQRDNLESELVQLTRTLSNIWESANAKDDLSSLSSFLTAVRCKEEGDTSSLANFILQKLSHAQEWETAVPDALPPCLWVDSESLQRNSEILGIGGYGKVHEAVWLGGHFAVKDFFYVENNTVFGREAAIQARLRHPNVISLVCCTKKPSKHKCSLVMELMQQDLRVWMLERLEAGMSPPFPLGVAMDLMLQIAQGMEYLHSLHIMHCDLKSSNILVSFSRKHLKISDFGMSKAKNASSKYTTKHVGATPWRAPEVFEINPEDEVEGNIDTKYTKKADVYSFGLVCYEILTGKCPFEGTQVKKRVLAGERPALPSYCPRALTSYIESCWNAEPSKRPPFSQICRVLRYLKTAVQLQDQHNQSLAHYSWLSQPLSDMVCARIDDMVRSFMGPRGSLFCPQPLSIPLEMYCCRVVLQQTAQTISIFSENSDSDMGGITITQKSFDFDEQLEQNHKLTSKLEQEQGKSPWRAKNHLFQWLKTLFCMHVNHRPKSEVLDALGLLRDFTFNELQRATAHFSKMIGEGGNGTVYYGRLEDGREIAVKVAMRPKALQSGRFFSVSETMGLVQELKIASQLRHRNIVPLFGWCQARGRFYLIYEFMVHGSLARHIFGEPNSLVLNWQQRYKIACQLASALKYLHQDSGYLQIVHRDVKVHNVLLDSEWNARLGDCGLALLLRDGHSPLHHLAGTVGYIAPECVVERRVSPASDVYAFGVTILVIVSGRRACSYNASSETYFVRDWVWELFQQGDVIKVADVRLKGEFDQMELKRLLLLGLSCSSADPSLRPCMEEVLKILSGMSEPPRLKIQTMQLDPATGSLWRQTSFIGDRERGTLTPKVQRNASPRIFLYKDLKLATRNFRVSNLLGEGGFGTVYKGCINEVGPNGTTVTTVAVKVLDLMSSQGHKEWLAEVLFLGQLHHPNLVKLKGFCSENERRILVYEFMANGCLEDHLFRKAAPRLTWPTRMKIALDAAKGLAFLHGAETPVIFRDLKPSNILLDSDYTAKLSDFGLAKLGPEKERTHVSTRVMGTYGYAAPEYIMTGHLTCRSDVYSFGIVLLELVTGRRVVDKNRGFEQQNLVEWARPYLRDKRAFKQIVDPRLDGIYPTNGAYKAASMAFRCLSIDPKSRPSMNDLVQKLESLQNIEERQK